MERQRLRGERSDAISSAKKANPLLTLIFSHDSTKRKKYSENHASVLEEVIKNLSLTSNTGHWMLFLLLVFKKNHVFRQITKSLSLTLDYIQYYEEC